MPNINNKDKLFIDALNEFKNSAYFRFAHNTNPQNLDEVFTLAIRLAYKDLQWRTIPKHDSTGKNENIAKIAKLFVCIKDFHPLYRKWLKFQPAG